MRNLNFGVEKISRVLWNVLRISKPENVMGIKHEKKRYDTLLKMRWIQRSLYKLSSYFCWKEEKSPAYLICRWVARDSKWNNIKMLLTGVTINDYKGLHHYKFIIWRDICHSKKMFWIENEFEKRFYDFEKFCQAPILKFKNNFVTFADCIQQKTMCIVVRTRKCLLS